MPEAASQPQEEPPCDWWASWSVSLSFLDVALELTSFDCETLPFEPGLSTRTWVLSFVALASDDAELVCETDPSSPGLSTRTETFVLLGWICVAPDAAPAACSF